MNKKFLVEAETIIDVPFHDIDALKIAWHGHYIKYFEIGRCTLLQKIGYDYPEMRDSNYSWPVIDVHLRYVKPAHYGEKITVIAGLLEYENRLKVGYRIENSQTGDTLTKGHTIQVAFNMLSNEMELVSPKILYDKLRAFL